MTIRTRLSLWYGSLMALVLAVALGTGYLAHVGAHLDELDGELRDMAAQAIEEVRAIPQPRASVDDGSLPYVVHAHHGLFLVDRDGHVLVAAGDVSERLTALVVDAPIGASTTDLGGERVRMLALRPDDSAGVGVVATGSLAELDASAERLRLQLLVIAGAGTVAAIAGGSLIARSALRPVAVLTETARGIAESRQFSRRVPRLEQEDELGELARTFDKMLESLDAAHGLQQRFVADASHELRTPLAIIQGNAEILDAPEADDGERAQAMAQIRRETSRLARLVDDLLVLARADAGSEPLRAEEVPLDEVLMEAFEELRPSAGRRLRVTGLEGAVVRGERDRLKQLVLIVLDNALRYTPADAKVEMALSIEDGAAVIRIDDEGVGVTPADIGRAFERFYRGEDARRIDPSGTGLGLSIARWIVGRHGGTVELQSRPAGGTRAVVRVPRAA